MTEEYAVSNRKEALAALAKIREVHNQEMEHIYADEVLCSLLSAIGYDDVVKEYDKINKWYA